MSLQRLLENLKPGTDLSDLPKFGGPEPMDTREVWSWDETYLLVGRCVDELYIEPRVDRLNDELQNWVPHHSPCLFRRRLGYAQRDLQGQRPKRSYTEQFVDQILDQVDFFELLCFYVADSNHQHDVYVLMDSEDVHFIHCSQNETPSPMENVIGVIATTRGENSFFWEGYASYDEDGQLVVDETGEAIRDQAAFESDPLSYFLPDLDLEEIYDNFRFQLREQLLARLRGEA